MDEIKEERKTCHKNLVHVTCYPDDKQKLNNDCIKTFLNENPSFSQLKIPEWYILRRIINYYLEH